MRSVVDERQITEEQQEMLELEELAPEKFDPEVIFIANKHAADPHEFQTYGEPYTKEQVAALLIASKAPPRVEPTEPPQWYPTMTREEAEFLVNDHYAYLEQEKQKRKERMEWDSLKTTESDVKTANTTKHKNSTKA